MKVQAIKTRVFRPNENLLRFIENYLPKIKDGDIIVVTSKIVALSEGRLVKKIDENTKIKIIRQESKHVLPTKYVYLTIKDGQIIANAGIDESNANGQLIMLPKNSFKTADLIRNHFKKAHKLKNLGIIITDSCCLPLRAGITGLALGYAGFRGLKDYRQLRDIFGQPFKYSRVDVADSLATAAVLLMGEGNEQQPLAIINEAPVEFSNRVNKNELTINPKEDIFYPLLKNLHEKK
jgi:coenzyme F420-0:L-glutamate ligase